MATVDLTKSRDLTGRALPVLRVKLSDRGQTLELSVLPPTVALQQELEGGQSDLTEALGSGVEEARVAVYDLAARLLSNNRQGVHVSAAQLPTRHRVTADQLITFFEAYTDFVGKLTSSKN